MSPYLRCLELDGIEPNVELAFYHKPSRTLRIFVPRQPPGYIGKESLLSSAKNGLTVKILAKRGGLMMIRLWTISSPDRKRDSVQMIDQISEKIMEYFAECRVVHVKVAPLVLLDFCLAFFKFSV